MSHRIPAITVDLNGYWSPPRWVHDRDGHPIKRTTNVNVVPPAQGHKFGGNDDLKCWHCGISWFTHRNEPATCPSKENV